MAYNQLVLGDHPTIQELKDKYGYRIGIFNIEDRAGYHIIVTNLDMKEKSEISYNDYHNLNQTNTRTLLENMCKRLLFRIEMNEIIAEGDT